MKEQHEEKTPTSATQTPHGENHQPQRHDMVPTRKECHTLQKSKIPQQNLHPAQFDPIILTLLTRC
jgi:hypothetical protein